MKFLAVLIASVSMAAAAAIVDRALPPGHPVISNEDLPSEANYTVRPQIFPDGFNVPTETLTGLPSGYSVGPTAVYGPDGSTVSEFPSSVISAVALQPSATDPAVTRETSTSDPTPTGDSSNAGYANTSAGTAAVLMGVVASVFAALF